MAALRAGALLARRYRLIDPVGAGGMSIIWRARDELLDRMVAIKVLSSELAADAKFRDLVREEARSAAQLVHPHVTSVHDYGEVVGVDGTITAFVVMELLSGEELEARLSAGPLPWQEAVEVCAQVAEALAAAHRLGIVHRDVTPANIMLTANGAKVLDFGIATHVGAPDEDEEGDTFGTPAYVAPERLDGVPAAPATDTYSLGVLLYETLSGRVPFPAETWDDLARTPPGGTMPPLEVPGLPQAVVDICRRCLAREPRERPTAHQVGEALREQLLPADPQAATMLSPTLTLPTVMPPAKADAGPVALAAGGGTATLVGVASTRVQPAPGLVGLPTDPGAPPLTGHPSDPGRGYPGGYPSDPGHPSLPDDPSGPGRGYGGHPSFPPTGDFGRRSAHRRPRGWSPVRAGFAATGAVAALTTALLVGVNLGEKDGRDQARQPYAPVQPAPTAGADPTVGGGPAVASATSAPAGQGPTAGPTSTAVPTVPPARQTLTVPQAVKALGAVIDAGINDGEIRRDVGIDLQQTIQNLRLEMAAGPAEIDDAVAGLRRKVAARANEAQAISPRYVTRIEAALDDLDAAR